MKRVLEAIGYLLLIPLVFPLIILLAYMAAISTFFELTDGVRRDEAEEKD